MEAKMAMQQMSMGNVHNSFWRDDQVTILFHSDKHLIVDGILTNAPLKELHLRRYVVQLSNFLKQHGVPVTLHFLDDSDQPRHKPMPQATSGMSSMADAFQLPAGVYAFGFPQPIESEFGLISTSVISFLQIEQHSSQGGSGSASMEMPGSSANGNGKNGSMDIIPRIVNTLNEHLRELNGIPDENLQELNEDEVIPITIAAPDWLTGGTPTGQVQQW